MSHTLIVRTSIFDSHKYTSHPTKTEQRNARNKKCYKLNEPSRYLQNISHRDKKIYFLLNTSYNFKIDYILIQKASLNICKKIEITPCIPSDYHRQNKTGYKQQKKKNKKLANSSKLNNLQLKRQKFKNLDLCENKISAYLDLQDT